MGFLQPSPPPFDLEEWKAKPYLARLKANAQDWAVNGFGTPGAVYLLYAVKLVVYVAAGFLIVAATTPGIGGLGDIGDWWYRPIVFQKLAVWTLMWEILGLGSGSMPLALRFSPPIGGVLYWLRPGTVRLPPFRGRLPLTRGTRRTVVDVALYAAVLAAAVYLLVSGGDPKGVLLDTTAIAVLLGLLALLGLRDKVPFLAARPEVYGFVLLVSLFPAKNLIPAWQLVFFFIWWGAASSKLNRHFPYVIQVMVSNTPWNRSRKMKAKLYRDHPEDLRPSRQAAFGAHLGTAVEFTFPLLLLVTNGGTVGKLALIGMLAFHIHIFSTFAMGVPMEWNLFMIFGLLFLFGHYGDVPMSNLDNPLLWAVLALVGVVMPVVGNLRPDLVSFLLSMRYYAGNWATSMWLFRKATDAEGRFDREIEKVAPVAVEQLTKIYDADTANYILEKGLAFRAIHSHGRALNALCARAVDGDIDDYFVREGEVISGIVTGWNFGEGHFHDEQLLDAVRERMSFEPGDLRVVMLESQPAHVQRQHYRIHDAATGLVEEGWIDVAEMVRRGPWLEGSFDFPVEVTRTGKAPAGRTPVA
ncbi:MAG: hypothetical protein QOE65_2904 [Solirubrobacteraceae bacterium]|jgi:hypothetical protein|nr:hypothetical protein [Solirubrobacteraceae bacterium]